MLSWTPAVFEFSEYESSKHGGNDQVPFRKEVVQLRKEKVNAALEENKMPSAELLRRQAREMSRNPAIVRKANPEMRHLTDAQV